jgi:hypothetical protein
MSFLKRFWIGLLFVVLAGAGGCGVQDPTQPAAGSISVGAHKDETAPSVLSGKTKAAAGLRK